MKQHCFMTTRERYHEKTTTMDPNFQFGSSTANNGLNDLHSNRR